MLLTGPILCRSRISLISKSDIRYVGKLANINSDDSTVSLENVRSFGTEGRRGNPDDELPPSDQIYEYIVFRGTDVKDLRIEEGPSAKENLPPAVPNDPAIVGVSLLVPLPPNLSLAFMMKYFGCKNFTCLKSANKTMLRFPLPSF